MKQSLTEVYERHRLFVRPHARHGLHHHRHRELRCPTGTTGAICITCHGGKTTRSKYAIGVAPEKVREQATTYSTFTLRHTPDSGDKPTTSFADKERYGIISSRTNRSAATRGVARYFPLVHSMYPVNRYTTPASKLIHHTQPRSTLVRRSLTR